MAARKLYRKLELIELEGHLYKGMTKLNDLTLWEVRADNYRLFLQFGGGKVFVGAICKKLTGNLRQRVYDQYEHEVVAFREAIQSGRTPCD